MQFLQFFIIFASSDGPENLVNNSFYVLVSRRLWLVPFVHIYSTLAPQEYFILIFFLVNSLILSARVFKAN